MQINDPVLLWLSRGLFGATTALAVWLLLIDLQGHCQSILRNDDWVLIHRREFRGLLYLFIAAFYGALFFGEVGGVGGLTAGVLLCKADDKVLELYYRRRDETDGHNPD